MNHAFGWLTAMHTGEIGLPKDRLPWSTLEVDLGKKEYIILNWPQGVVRDRDKGISGLSAEDTNKLHDALFRDERRLQFVRCGRGKFLGISGAAFEALLNPLPEAAHRNDGADLQANASTSEQSRERDRPSILIAAKKPRFRVTTAETYPHKRRRA